jgi:hypothetical protein
MPGPVWQWAVWAILARYQTNDRRFLDWLLLLKSSHQLSSCNGSNLCFPHARDSRHSIFNLPNLEITITTLLYKEAVTAGV